MSGQRRYAFRIFAGLLIAGALVHVATAVPRVIELVGGAPLHGWLIATAYAVSAATALSACGLGALLLWKVPDRADARALTLFLGFLAFFWGSLFRFIEVEAGATSMGASISYGDDWVGQTAAASFVLAVAAFVRFSALFPRPLTADRLPPAKRLRGLRRLRAAGLRGGVVWGIALGGIALLRFAPVLMERMLGEPTPETGTIPLFVALNVGLAIVLYLVLPLPAMAYGSLNLRTSYRIAASDERRRILWVVAGFSAASWMVLGALGLLVLIATTELGGDVFAAVVALAVFLAPLVLVSAAALGVLRSGAIDPGLVLQRSTVWGALGALGVVAFAALENAASAWIEGRLRLPGFLGSMAAGGVVALALIPLRKPLQRVVRRWAARLAASESGGSRRTDRTEDNLRAGDRSTPESATDAVTRSRPM